MESFESSLKRATESRPLGLLAAIGVVFSHQGSVLYDHGGGHCSFAANSPPPNLESTVYLGSAGKFDSALAIAHLIANGALELDEPIFSLVPELESLPIISAAPDVPSGFSLRPRTKPITLRHMLTYSSGIAGSGDALVQDWLAATEPAKFPAHTNHIVKQYSQPLLFEPGEGWNYGHDIHWLQLVIERAAGRWLGDKGQEYLEEHGQGYVSFMRDYVFKPLEMNSSRYSERDELLGRRIQTVRRAENGGLDEVPETSLYFGGLMCSVSDLKRGLVELITPNPKVLTKGLQDQFHTAAFPPASNAESSLRGDTECYDFPAGLAKDGSLPPVNWSWGGLLVQDQLPLSGFPAGTVTWNGSPNVAWAVNREKGVGMLFATQLSPVDDERTVEVMLEFFKSAVSEFW